MAHLTSTLRLDRCPHCQIAKPCLQKKQDLKTVDSGGDCPRTWGIYVCTNCGGVVSAWAEAEGHFVREVFPSAHSISAEIPEKPRMFLKQARESMHAPSGAVMLAASAVDAMLKMRGFVDGNLFSRIKKATEEHLITPEMARWAHDVRLDANDQRHADQEAALPNQDDAQRSLDFALALAEILFVLPARVQHGIAKAQKQSKKQ